MNKPLMDQDATAELLERARQGDHSAVGALLELHRGRLKRLLALRLDGRLRGRIDPADVIQDVFLEACSRLGDYLRKPVMPFYLWVRFLAIQRLKALSREHLGAQKRDVRREVQIDAGRYAGASSEVLAARLLGKLSTPSQTASREELRSRLRETLDAMESRDREVIALRHFESLGNAEVALVLGLDESAASKRYVRAMGRLRERLERIPGMTEYPWK